MKHATAPGHVSGFRRNIPFFWDKVAFAELCGPGNLSGAAIISCFQDRLVASEI